MPLRGFVCAPVKGVTLTTAGVLLSFALEDSIVRETGRIYIAARSVCGQARTLLGGFRAVRSMLDILPLSLPDIVDFGLGETASNYYSWPSLKKVHLTRRPCGALIGL